MMSHEMFVFLAYAVSAVTLIGLFVWIVLDGRSVRRDLANLEAQGIRRRSAPSSEPKS